MALGAIAGASSLIGGSGAIGGIGKVAGGAIGKVKDIAGGAVDSIGGALGIGPGNEKVKGWPDGVPRGKDRSAGKAGELFDNFNYLEDEGSLTLYPGRYAYDDLSRAGLHDSASSIKVRDGYVVVLYKGVEGGKPAGQKKVIEGPAEIPRFDRIGFENQVSSVAVAKKPQQQRASVTSGPNGNSSTGSGSTGSGSTGSGSGGSTQPTPGNSGGAGGMMGQLQSSLFNPITIVLAVLGVAAFYYEG